MSVQRRRPRSVDQAYVGADAGNRPCPDEVTSGAHATLPAMGSMVERVRDPHGRCEADQEVAMRGLRIRPAIATKGAGSRTHARATVRPRGSPAQQARSEHGARERAGRDGATVPERHERDGVVHAVEGIAHRADAPGGEADERAGAD